LIINYEKIWIKKVAPAGKIDYESELNPQQLKAVLASDGPALVIAGAGSGKTRVVTYRVAYLLERGVSPEEILLLTFTKKAAGEMLRRVEDLVMVDAARIWGGTFHHVGNRILRQHAELLGFKNNYTILDRDDSRVLVDTVVREAGVDTKAKRFPKGRVLLEIIGYARNTDSSIEEAVEVKVPHFLKLISEIEMVAVRYARKKKELNYMDFDDLLIYFAELLSNHPEIAEKSAVSSSISWSMNIRTPTGYRPELSISSAAAMEISWWWEMTPNRSTHSAVHSSATSGTSLISTGAAGYIPWRPTIDPPPRSSIWPTGFWPGGKTGFRRHSVR